MLITVCGGNLPDEYNLAKEILEVARAPRRAMADLEATKKVDMVEKKSVIYLLLPKSDEKICCVCKIRSAVVASECSGGIGDIRTSKSVQRNRKKAPIRVHLGCK